MPRIVFHRGLLKCVLPSKEKDDRPAQTRSSPSRSRISQVASFIGLPTLRRSSASPNETASGVQPARRTVRLDSTGDGSTNLQEIPNLIANYSGPVGAGREPLLFRTPLRETEAVLVYDQNPPAVKGDMSFFRTTANLTSVPHGHDTTGMRALRLSGSERISSVEQVQRIRDAAGGGPLVVVDLRQESHAIAADYPITWRGPMDWANVGLTQDEAVKTEAMLIDQLRERGSATLVHADYVKGKASEPEHVTVETTGTRTEQQVVEAAGATYERLNVIDHARPDREAVDQFIDLVRSLPNDATLHVHCNGGRGRTTTFMTMYDMLRNAAVVDATAIIERQETLGYDYNMANIAIVRPEKLAFFEDRLAFLHEFHEYARHNPNGQPLKWSEWRTTDAPGSSVAAAGTA